MWSGWGLVTHTKKIPLVRSVIVVSQVCFMYYLNLGSFFSSMEKKSISRNYGSAQIQTNQLCGRHSKAALSWEG